MPEYRVFAVKEFRYTQKFVAPSEDAVRCYLNKQKDGSAEDEMFLFQRKWSIEAVFVDDRNIDNEAVFHIDDNGNSFISKKRGE